MDDRRTSMKVSSLLAAVVFFSCLQGSWSQFDFPAEVISIVYDDTLNMEEWANWSFDFQGAAGFFFVNFHSFKFFEGHSGIDICLGGFDGFKIAFMNGTFTIDEGFLQFSILDEGHFISEQTKVDLFNTPYKFNTPGPLLEPPHPFVWTTYQIDLGINDGNFFQFYNQGPHTNCFVLDSLTIFEEGPDMPPSPPSPPPPAPMETIVFDVNFGGLQEGFQQSSFGATNDLIPNGFSNELGIVTLGPFDILNIFRTGGSSELLEGPANLTIVTSPVLPEDIEDFNENIEFILEDLSVSIVPFNFGFTHSTLIGEPEILNNPDNTFEFFFNTPGFGVDGIQFKSELSSGAQRFRIDLISFFEIPFEP